MQGNRLQALLCHSDNVLEGRNGSAYLAISY